MEFNSSPVKHLSRELSSTGIRRTTTTTIPTRQPTSFSTSTRPREVVRSRTLARTLPSRNSLLQRGNTITHERVPEDFVFPEEVIFASANYILNLIFQNSKISVCVQHCLCLLMQVVSEEKPLPNRFSRKSVLVGAAAVPNALTSSSQRRRKTFRPSTHLQQSTLATSASSSSGFRDDSGPWYFLSVTLVNGKCVFHVSPGHYFKAMRTRPKWSE